MSHGKNALRAIKQTQKAKKYRKKDTEKELKSEQAILSILELVFSDSEELLLLLFFAMVFLALYVF